MPYRVSLLFCCCLIAGCGSSGLCDVQAVVTLDGKPLTAAQVALISHWDDTKSALGITDTEGRVTFQTAEEDGVFPGAYTVVVSKTVEERRLSNDEVRALAEVGIRYEAKIIEFVPAKYTRRETSDLRITIRKHSPQDLTFALQSAIAE